MSTASTSVVRAALVGAFALAIAVVAFVLRQSVPVLDLFDLGIHELGHLLAAPLPRLLMFAAGSIAQVAFPLAMAWYFHAARGDTAAAGFCLAWAGTSARNVSIYAGDAVAQSLPLIGGEHDWAYILGPRGLDALEHTAAVSASILVLGAALAAAGVAVAARALHRAWEAGRSEPIAVRRPAGAASVADPWD